MKIKLPAGSVKVRIPKLKRPAKLAVITKTLR